MGHREWARSGLRIGQVDTASNTIKWGNNNNAFKYDNGMNPSVAISGSTVVEVHNALVGVGPLWMRIGQVDTARVLESWKLMWMNQVFQAAFFSMK